MLNLPWPRSMIFCFDLQWSMSSESISSNRCQLFSWNRGALIQFPQVHVFELETDGISEWLYGAIVQCYITEITILGSMSLPDTPVHSYKRSLATRPLTQLTTCLFFVNPPGVSAKHGLLLRSPWGSDQPLQETTLETTSSLKTLVRPNYDFLFLSHSSTIMLLTIYLHFFSSIAGFLIQLTNKPDIIYFKYCGLFDKLLL